MPDRGLRLVLTLIAVALSGLLLCQLVRPQPVRAQIGARNTFVVAGNEAMWIVRDDKVWIINADAARAPETQKYPDYVLRE